jgi:hypothetical protein
MRKLSWRTTLGLLAGMLALAPSVNAQTTGVLTVPLNPAVTTVDLLFTPIQPCRIIDTRLAGGPIGAGTTRDFVVAGAAGFAAQGGNAAGCGIPLGAPAAVINYVAVGPAGPGDLRVTASGTPVPTASVINYAALGGLNIANGVATPLAAAVSPHITIQADVSGTDLVADVLGYFRTVTCQAGAVKLGGQCFESALRPAATLFAAADTCALVGGRLADGLELRALRSGTGGAGFLTLDALGEWYAFIDNVAGVGSIVNDNGVFNVDVQANPHPFRCVFRALP